MEEKKYSLHLIKNAELIEELLKLEKDAMLHSDKENSSLNPPKENLQISSCETELQPDIQELAEVEHSSPSSNLSPSLIEKLEELLLSYLQVKLKEARITSLNDLEQTSFHTLRSFGISVGDCIILKNQFDSETSVTVKSVLEIMDWKLNQSIPKHNKENDKPNKRKLIDQDAISDFESPRKKWKDTMLTKEAFKVKRVHR